MIADPDVNNEDSSKRYTHDTIRELSYYNGKKKVDLDLLDHAWYIKVILKLLLRC